MTLISAISFINTFGRARTYHLWYCRELTGSCVRYCGLVADADVDATRLHAWRDAAWWCNDGIALPTIAEANRRPVAAVASQRCPRRNLSEEIGQEPPRGASNLNLDEPPSVLEVSQENAHDVNVVGRVALPKEANGQLAGAFRELLEFRTETAKLRAETAEFQAKLRAETAEARRKTADLGADIATHPHAD